MKKIFKISKNRKISNLIVIANAALIVKKFVKSNKKKYTKKESKAAV